MMLKKDEEKSKQAEFTGWWIIAVVILVFLAILFFEFRKDIFAKISKGKKMKKNAFIYWDVDSYVFIGLCNSRSTI